MSCNSIIWYLYFQAWKSVLNYDQTYYIGLSYEGDDVWRWNGLYNGTISSNEAGYWFSGRPTNPVVGMTVYAYGGHIVDFDGEAAVTYFVCEKAKEVEIIYTSL